MKRVVFSRSHAGRGRSREVEKLEKLEDEEIHVQGEKLVPVAEKEGQLDRSGRRSHRDRRGVLQAHLLDAVRGGCWFLWRTFLSTIDEVRKRRKMKFVWDQKGSLYRPMSKQTRKLWSKIATTHQTRPEHSLPISTGPGKSNLQYQSPCDIHMS
jgi:hypothetical protein